MCMYNLKIALSSVFYSLCLFIALSGSLLSLPDGFLVINSDLNHITIEYCPQFNNFQEIKYEDGSISWYPLISGTSLSNHNNGEPSHLVIIKSLTVPGPNLFSIENIETSDIKYFNKLITPNNIYDKIDKQMYQSYKLPPWATLEYAGIARNRYIAHLKITATRYNPLTGNIEIPSKVKVKIKFNSLLSGNDNYKMIDDYDNSASINHNISRKWIIPSTTKNSKLDIVKSTVSDKILNVNNQTWLKIKIEEEGVYKIDATQLAKFGFNIASDDPATIQIFGNDGKELSENVYDALNNKMNEQEIIIKTKQGNELDYILFYAKPAYGFEYKSGKFKHYINLFSKYNYYLLTWGGSSGKRANVIEPPNGTPALEPMTYTEMLFHEEELYNAFEYPGSGREWFGRYIMSNSQSNEYTNVLYNLEPDSKISYNFSFAHRSNSTGTFSVKESNKKILSIDVPPRSGYVSSVRRRVSSETSSNDISNNKIVLDFDYNSSSGIASAYLDWFEIYYTRKFIPVDNQISFFTDPKHQGIIQYSINGFQGEEIFGFDITNPANPKLLKNLSQTGGMFIFKTTVEQNNPGRFYITSKIKNANLEKTNFGNLRTNFANTDIIIITHNQLLESAILFKEYRTAFSNLTATIILTEHIFNEFSSGIADPTAIRDYLAFAYTYWSNKPKYVVLWGDGHYDYKNIEYNSINYIPPYESFENLDSFDGVQSFTSDDFFARIVGDDPIIDIAIGRIPVDSPATDPPTSRAGIHHR